MQAKPQPFATILFLARGAALLTVLAGLWRLFGLPRWAGRYNDLPEAALLRWAVASGFMLAGVSLWLRLPGSAPRWRRWTADGAACTVLLLGVTVWLGTRVGRGQASPETAVSFCLVAAALIWLDREIAPGHWPASWLAAVVLLLSLFVILGHAYHAEELFRIGSFKPMAFYSAVSFLGLSGGVLCARPQRQPMALLASDSAGGRLARRLLPAALGGVLALNWLQWAGQRAGWFDAAFGAAFSTLGDAVALTVLILLEARWLHRAEAERQRLEEEVRQSHDRFQHLFQSSPAAICLSTLAQGLILEVNESWIQLTGFTRAEALGRTTMDLGLWLTLDQRTELVEQARRLGGARNVETQFRTKSGEVRVALMSVEIVDLGLQRCLIYTIADITEKKRLQAQFLRAQRLEIIGTLAGGIAHDLNNVLTPILISASLLREPLPEAERRSLLESLESNAQRGANVAKQLLTFGRGLGTARVPLNAKHLIREIAGMIQEFFPKSVTVKASWPANPWSVAGEPTQLHQVLLNLCVNARDAMPEGGLLSVGAEHVELDELFVAANPEAKSGPYVLFSVADTGTGIAPEHLSSLFEPFFTTKPPGQGTGLGLATARKIIREHGGFITVSSTRGQGAQFKVFLPALTDKSANAGLPALAVQALPFGQGELVLVVDDEPAIRQALGRALEDNGYHVLLAADGHAALALYRQHGTEIKATLTDMDMPGPAGNPLTEAFRQTNPKARIICISGHSRGADAESKLDAFLAKPFTARQLLETLKAVLTGQ